MKRYFEWERAGKLMLSATRYRLIIQCIHKLVQGRAHFRERILFHGNNLTGSVRGSLGQINGISRKLTLEDRTLSYIVLKPLARWRIALPKLLASVVVTGPLLAVAGFVMTAILLDGDVRASVAAGVALLVGVLVYSSIFTWAGVMFGSGSAALGAAIVYVFIWEGLIGTFLGGIRYLSVRGYTLAIMQGIDEESFEEFADRVIELPAAVVGASAVVVVFFALTIRRLRRMDVP